MGPPTGVKWQRHRQQCGELSRLWVVLCGVCRYDWGSCEAPNKANIERFTSVLAKCIKKAVEAGKDIAVLAHLDLEKVSLKGGHNVQRSLLQVIIVTTIVIMIPV